MQDVCAPQWRTIAHGRRLMSDSIQISVWMRLCRLSARLPGPAGLALGMVCAQDLNEGAH
jgi:hypothetical protein